MPTKVRADQLLHQRELAESRSRAQALILAGKVFSGERRVEKAGEQIMEDAPLEVRGHDHPYVSRGGLKIAGALEELGFDPKGVIAADFGASTGGFTDALLQRGAKKVYAIDVGYGQLHNKLRQDDRVVSMERTNARQLKAGDLDDMVDLVVIDASFIGLAKLLPAAHALLRAGGDILAMVKPQFEVGRDQVGKGGVVRDSQVRDSAIDAVIEVAKDLGLSTLGQSDSPIKGPKGNQETFVWLRKSV